MVTFITSVNDCQYIIYSNEMTIWAFFLYQVELLAMLAGSTGATSCSSQDDVDSPVPLVWPLWQHR